MLAAVISLLKSSFFTTNHIKLDRKGKYMLKNIKKV